MKPLSTLTLLCALLTALPAPAATPPADEKLVITRRRDPNGFLEPIPVSISGFTGEADSALKNDLIFMGVKNVPADEAKYLIQGGNTGQVWAVVTDKLTRKEVLRKAFTGGGTRSLVHALSDAIAGRLTDLPGIAQKKITFKVESGRAQSEAYLADFDGFNSTRVTSDGSIIAGPAWAGPNMLIYASYKPGPPQIFSHVLSTGARQAVARHPGGNYSPAVSPNGRRVAMILSKDGNPELYVANIDGSGLKRLTTTREAESSPCWSPDNETICFASRMSQVARLYTIGAAGGTPRVLSTGGAPNSTEPDWSPDGRWIAFTSLTGGFNIFIVRATGGEALGPLVGGEDPSWAANSRALIFCTGRDHAKTLSLLDVPTKHVKPLARILESNSQPSWAK